MPRRYTPARRPLLPDIRFKSVLVSEFINRMMIDGKKIYELPGVQPDVMSDVLEVNASAPGWYALKILYFEKRNTSTLQLFWAPPGVADLAIITPAALGYVE